MPLSMAESKCKALLHTFVSRLETFREGARGQVHVAVALSAHPYSAVVLAGTRLDRTPTLPLSPISFRQGCCILQMSEGEPTTSEGSLQCSSTCRKFFS